MGTLVGVAGVAGVAAAMTSFAKSSFEAADAIGDAADRAGIAVDALSRLKYAAEQNDVDFSSLTVALKRWQVTLSQAASGSKDAGASLKLLQLSAAELKSLSLEDQLRKIADQFSRIRDPADQTRVAVELFGRSGEQLVPLLRQGGSAIGELTKEADRLGITLDQSTTQAVDRADKALKTLKATISSFGSRVVGGVAQVLVGPGDELDSAFAKLEQLKKKRDELVNAGPITRLLVPEGPRMNAIKQFNEDIGEQLRLINAIQRARKAAAGDKPDLTIPLAQGDITEVSITAKKRELEGIAKLLDQFDEQTRSQLEQINHEYEATLIKLNELFRAGAISQEQFTDRVTTAIIKMQEAVEIEPVKVTVQRVSETLSAQETRIHDFVSTVKEGLTNLAQSGEVTGKSIVRYLLSALQSKVIFRAIEALGSALSDALKKSASNGNAVGAIASVVGGLFGHSAGGGRNSGPRIVGEEGPELFMGDGNVMNRRQLAFAAAGMGGGISIGDTQIIVQGTSDPERTAQYVEARIQANNRRQIEQINNLMKRNYGRALR